MLEVSRARRETDNTVAFDLEYPEDDEVTELLNDHPQEDDDDIFNNDREGIQEQVDSAERLDSGPDPFDLILDDDNNEREAVPSSAIDLTNDDLQFTRLGTSFLRPKENDNDNDDDDDHHVEISQNSDNECPFDELADLFATSGMLYDGRKVKIPYKKQSRLAPKAKKTFDQLISSNNIKQASINSNYGIDICGILEEIEQQEKLTSADPSLQTQGDNNNVIADNGVLWSEKWRPKRWIDLVGEEKTHRHIMRWLKTWSPLIFNTEAPESTWKTNAKLMELNQDPLQRPQKKILMIHGPPGLGKTSLAHVIAAQAGYDVMEINASDERGGPIVKAKIMNALTSHRMDGRPVCIIADEVEGGAETGFIKTLVDIVIADQRACQQQKFSNNTRQQRKKNKPKLILRPIITICNDPYTTSLRNLRPYVELIPYRRASSERIVSRLREITKAEGLKMSNMELKEIVEANCGDMRSCLNSIQFRQDNPELAVVRNKKTNQIRDISFDRNTIVSHVFTRNGGIDTRESCRQIGQMVNCNGEYDKLSTGCFTSYPHMYYHDDMVQKPTKACDWLFFNDMINRGIYNSQQGSLTQYLGESIVAFHVLFRTTRNPFDKKEFNSGFFQPDYDFYEAKKSNKEIEKQFVSGICPELLRFIKPSLASCEIAPYFAKIITADVEPSAGTNRRVKVDHLLDAMIRLNIKLVQQRTDSGGYVYCLDPPIQNIVTFTESEGNKIGFGKFSSRQLLCQEVEAEILKREAIKASVRGNLSDNGQGSIVATTNDKSQAQVQQQAGKRKSQRDFFGWAKKVKSGNENNGTNGKERKKHVQVVSLKVWIHYNEGYSNAIRKTAVWKDLW